MAGLPHRYVFLAGLAPALIVLWIRQAVPETGDWHAAKEAAGEREPGIMDLFRGSVLKTTLLTMAVCALSLTGHWAFVFWQTQHLRRLPEVARLSPKAQTEIVGQAWILLMLASIAGNFLAAAIARKFGYKRTIAAMALAYFASMMLAYGMPRSLTTLRWCFPLLGASSGFFALFTMYLPPLFPTLLRTTGAGFCYNIGRIAAAAGTVFFGLISPVGDHRIALVCAGTLFLPAALIALAMPEGERVHDEPLSPAPAADDGHPLSSQRPMSAAERSELEAVYQDRGCGVECDP
jgi:MFS family permease